jgi:alpha-tubulin suppressor-like RCC1 family protein
VIVESRNQVVCFGFNMVGQLADDSYKSTFRPTIIARLPEGKKWVRAVNGQAHACAESADGEIWCWGWNGFCQLGIGYCGGNEVPNVPQPQRVVGF